MTWRLLYSMGSSLKNFRGPKDAGFRFCRLGVLFLVLFFIPGQSFGRMKLIIRVELLCG